MKFRSLTKHGDSTIRTIKDFQAANFKIKKVIFHNVVFGPEETYDIQKGHEFNSWSELFESEFYDRFITGVEYDPKTHTLSVYSSH